MRAKGAVVVVSGASSGIGRATAERFAKIHADPPDAGSTLRYHRAFKAIPS